MTRMVDAHQLMSSADVADLIGVARSTFSNWKARGLDVPTPVTTIANGTVDVYLRPDVILWFRRRNPLLTEALTASA